MPSGKENIPVSSPQTSRAIANNTTGMGSSFPAVQAMPDESFFEKEDPRPDNREVPLPFSLKKNTGMGILPVQREIFPYNQAVEHPKVKAFAESLNKKVLQAHTYLIDNPYIKIYSDLDGHTKHWLMLWLEAKEEKSMPQLFQAAAGYVIESIATFEMENESIDGIEMRTQVAKAGTRPDVVLLEEKKEIAWLDITASGSKDHIFTNKQGWEDKACVEVRYDSITHSDFEKMKSSTGEETTDSGSPHWRLKNTRTRMRTDKLQEEKRNKIVKAWIAGQEDTLTSLQASKRMNVLKEAWNATFKTPITPKTLMSVLWAIRWKASTTAIKSYLGGKTAISEALGWYTIFETLSGTPETDITEEESAQISKEENVQVFETLGTTPTHSLTPQREHSKSFFPERKREKQSRQSLGGQVTDSSPVEELPEETTSKIDDLIARYRAFDKAASLLVKLIQEDNIDIYQDAAKEYLQEIQLDPREIKDIKQYEDIGSLKGDFKGWIEGKGKALVTVIGSTTKQLSITFHSKEELSEFLKIKKGVEAPQHANEIYTTICRDYGGEVAEEELDQVIKKVVAL
jgi:hypothetical protein